MLIFLQKAVQVDGIQTGVRTTLKLKRSWKPGIYTNRICGEGEVAASAMILVALSLTVCLRQSSFENQITCNIVTRKLWTSTEYKGEGLLHSLLFPDQNNL